MPPLFINVDLDSGHGDDGSLLDPLDCSVDGMALKKNVGFAPLHINVMYPVTHLDDMEEEEITNTWYNRAELKAMKRSAMCTVQKMNLGMKVEESVHETARGLHHLTHEGSVLRRDFMRQRVKAVVQQQDHKDCQQLKRISERFSRTNTKEAMSMGQCDAFSVEEYLASLRKELEAEVDEDMEEIPPSLCLNLCSLRRSLTRLGCKLRRSLSTPDVMMDQAKERTIQVV